MNKNVLKLWILACFGMTSVVMFSFVMLLEGKLEFAPFLLLSGIGVITIYYCVLKGEIEKMQEEYEEAGSLKKTVERWKEADK